MGKISEAGLTQLRITFILTQSLESPSGLGRYWPLSKELVRLGHQVTILALHHDFQSLSCAHFVQQGVDVCYVGQMHVQKVGHTKMYFGPLRLLSITLLATGHLLRNALRVHADVYHLGKPHPMNGLAAYVAHIARHVPLYLDCDDYEAASNRFGERWQQQGVAFFEDWLPKVADGITTNTHFMLERLKGATHSPLVYVPNGVDRERFADKGPESIALLRRRLHLEEKKVVLYIGSLSLVSHAVDLLLDAFSMVYHYDSRAFLLVVGGGEDYALLQQQTEILGIKEAVLFVGRVPPSEVPAYYRLAMVSVDAARDSLAERARAPLKVVESLVAGTPVVTGAVGDRCIQLAAGGGLLVSPDDPGALASALLTVLQDNALHHRLSEEALVIGETYYWDRLVHDFVHVYQS